MSGKDPLGQSKESQAYEGVNVIVPIGGWQLIKARRAPTSNDKKYPIGSLWVDTVGLIAYVLLAAPGTWSSIFASTTGNLVFAAAGNKTVYSSVASTTAAGANSAGTVTLAGGTATIATTSVTAASFIRISRQGIGATGAAALGALTIGTITAGTSFVINAVQPANATALQASDVSVIAWEIVN